MSTGEVLRVRAAMKPISTVPRALDTIDTHRGGGGQGDPPALRRLRRARRRRRRRGHGRARRWPRPASRSSAATRWPRPRATTRHTSPRSRRRCARGDLVPRGRRPRARSPSSSVRPARARAPSARRLAAALGVALARHGRRDRGRAGRIDLGHLRRPRRGALPRARARRGGPRAHRGDVRRVARRWCPDRPGHAGSCSRGHTVVFLDVGIADAARRIGFEGNRPLLMVNPRATLDQDDERAPRHLRAAGDRPRRHRRPQAGRRSWPRRSSRAPGARRRAHPEEPA